MKFRFIIIAEAVFVKSLLKTDCLLMIIKEFHIKFDVKNNCSNNTLKLQEQ